MKTTCLRLAVKKIFHLCIDMIMIIKIDERMILSSSDYAIILSFENSPVSIQFFAKSLKFYVSQRIFLAFINIFSRYK